MSEIFYHLFYYAATILPRAEWEKAKDNVRPALFSTATEYQKKYAFDYLRQILSAD
jgi:hypothetical protein